MGQGSPCSGRLKLLPGRGREAGKAGVRDAIVHAGNQPVSQGAQPHRQDSLRAQSLLCDAVPARQCTTRASQRHQSRRQTAQEQPSSCSSAAPAHPPRASPPPPPSSPPSSPPPSSRHLQQQQTSQQHVEGQGSCEIGVPGGSTVQCTRVPTCAHKRLGLCGETCWIGPRLCKASTSSPCCAPLPHPSSSSWAARRAPWRAS